MKYFDKLYARGVEEVKNKKVVFCGMVRDCGSEVRHNIETIEQMGSFFADYRVVINENNSVDNTKEVLRKWASDNDKVVAICNDFDESNGVLYLLKMGLIVQIVFAELPNMMNIETSILII